MNRRSFPIFILAFGVLLAALMFRSGTMALVALPLLVYLGMGLWEAPSTSEIRLAADRTLQGVPGDGVAVVVRVSVSNQGTPIALLRLSDPPRAGMTISDGPAELWETLPTGGNAVLTYTFHSPRGVFRWRTISVRASDPFRLFEHETEVPAPGEIVIRPRVRKFRTFSLRPEHTLRSPGTILARAAGSGTDFWDIREYRPGDPLRRLDWRRAARNPGQLFTRQFEREEIADVGIILDSRWQSDLQCGRDCLFEHSLGAAVSLSEMLLRCGNRVGLVVVGDAMRVVYPGYGHVQLGRVLRVLADARPGVEPSRLSVDQAPLRFFSTRALIVFISPMARGEWQIFSRLRARGNEGVLISPDPLDFLSAEGWDPAGECALRIARVERRLALRRISRMGTRIVDWPVRTPLSPLLRRAVQSARGEGGSGR